MQDPVCMQVLAAVQQLEHDALHSGWGDRMPCRLGVMMDDLEEVMLGILEDHENTFVLENDFDEPDHIHMTQLGTEGHLTDS